MAALLFTHNSSIIIIEDDLTGPQECNKRKCILKQCVSELSACTEQLNLQKASTKHLFISPLSKTNNIQDLQMQVVKGDGSLWEIINRLKEIF